MAVNLGNILHFIFPLAICLIGFHGVFFYSNLSRKAGFWCVFQMGLELFLIQAAPTENAMALALLVGSVTAAVGALLFAFCLKLRRRYKTFDGAEIANRTSR